VKPVIAQVVYEQFLSLDTVKGMGWWNLAWVAFIAFLALAARAKKVGVTSIGKNEWGILEILGFPTIPIPFGIWPFIKGVFHVKQASTVPIRVPMVARREINKRVLMVSITVWVTVTRPATGSLWDRIRRLPWRFVEIRRDLIAAIYGALDENVDDSENPERIIQTVDIVEDATRFILKDAKSVDDVTVEALDEKCGEDLRTSLGEYIKKVYIREDAPVDGQLWKEGRSVILDEVDDELPPAPPQLEAVPTAIA
jgi:hypothetical protein